MACVLLAALVPLPATVLGQSTDRLISADGTLSGKVVALGRDEVQIEDRGGEIRKVPIDRLRDVQFAGEPQSLRSARGMLARGSAAAAIEELAKVEAAELDGADAAVLADMEYVKAVAAGRAALISGSDPREPGRLVNDFITKHAESHHYYEAQELLGDLLARAGRVDNAIAAYSQLSKGPPALRVRAAAAKARMLLDQRKYQEALAEFDAAIAVDASDEAAVAQKRDAALGRARSLIGLGRVDDAIGVVQAVIDAADPEEGEALGAAYATLGAAYRAASGKEQDALIAFLTVDLIYNAVPDAHAEALANLVVLWERAGNPERAREARATLEASYPGSRWAREVAGKAS
ncbi:MAG: tetratricopeptide repeat protein [Planctomycetaceae bacterium]